MKYSWALVFISFFFIKYLSEGSEYKIEYLTTEDGLPQSFIYCSFQDSRGFLWFGTRNGLCRYDGLKFMVFQHDPFDSTTLSGNIITDILEDSKGNLWVATQNSGLNYLYRKTGDIRRFRHNPGDPSSLCNDKILELEISSRDELWIATRKGLSLFIPGREGFSLPPEISPEILEYIEDARISSIKMRRDDVLFIKRMNEFTSDNRLLKFNLKAGEYSIIRAERRIGGNVMNILGFDPSGNIYFYISNISGHKEILLIDRESGAMLRSIIFSTRINQKYFNAYPELDSKNNLWMIIEKIPGVTASDSKNILGLYSLGNIEKLDSIVLNKRIIGSTAQYIKYGNFFSRDNNNIIWTFTLNGLSKLIPVSPGLRNYRYDPLKNSISSNYIRSMYIDCNGDLYVGTDNGLNIKRKDSDNWELFPKSTHSALAKEEINVIYSDYDGSLLLGTNLGVYNYNPETNKLSLEFEDILYKEFTTPLSIWSLYRDRQKTLWVGSFSGFFFFDSDNNLIDRYGPDRIGEDDLPVWIIYEDRKGNVWAGTEYGLFKWLPEKREFKIYRHDPADTNSICGNNVWSITEDMEGNLWIGAYGAGISKYDYESDNFESLTIRDGLPDNGIVSVLSDDSNNLWLGTGKGLVRYDQKRGEFRVFGTDDGFANREYGFHAYFKCNDGSLFFGGLNGFTQFYPDSLVQNTNIPPIAVTSFKVLGNEIFRELSDGDTINIGWDDKYFSFEFAALDYLYPEQNRYAYKMEGYDRDWVETGTVNKASFSHLEPGEYIFRLKGASSHGEWNEAGISIYVNIVAPFWMTFWFRALGISVAAGTIIFIYLYRQHERRQKEQAKRRILVSQLKALQSQMNPHFIFNSLNSILNLIIKKENELSTQYLTKFSRLLRNILENSRSMSVTLAQEIEYLTMYLELESLRFENNFKYNINVDEDIGLEETMLPTLLIQPYVENALRHGMIHTMENGMVSIDFKLSEDYLICEITDNGIGRQRSNEIKAKAKYLHKSLGMAVNRERLELLNSKVEVVDLQNENGNPAGTKVILMLNRKTDLTDEE